METGGVKTLLTPEHLVEAAEGKHDFSTSTKQNKVQKVIKQDTGYCGSSLFSLLPRRIPLLCDY